VASTISNVQSIGFWVYPTSTTTSLVALTATKYISASSGTVSATGFTSPTIYVNGVVASTIVANKWQYVVVTTGTAISSTAITLGRANSSNLTGMLDDVRLYNYERAIRHVAWDYNLGKPLVRFKFDENTGTIAHDSSEFGINGTLTNGPAWISGKRNYGLNFSGADDYVSVPDANQLDITDSITIAAWIKPGGDTGSARTILTKRTEGSNITTYALNLAVDSYLLSFSFTNSTGSSFDVFKQTSETMSSNQWYFVTVTDFGGGVGADNNIHLYINGKEVAGTWTTGGNIARTANTSALSIGSRTNGSDEFDGVIDDVQIYNYVLNPPQIQAIMNNGAISWEPATGTP
jgi:hypothetical protein